MIVSKKCFNLLRQVLMNKTTSVTFLLIYLVCFMIYCIYNVEDWVAGSNYYIKQSAKQVFAFELSYLCSTLKKLNSRI